MVKSRTRTRKTKGGRKRTTRRRVSRRTRKSRRGGKKLGLLGAAKTALLPFLLYSGQKAMQRRVNRRNGKSRSRR